MLQLFFFFLPSFFLFPLFVPWAILLSFNLLNQFFFPSSFTLLLLSMKWSPGLISFCSIFSPVGNWMLNEK